jgi:hypothetical protein
VPDDGEAEADAVGGGDGRRPRLRNARQPEHKFASVEHRLVQVGVGSGFACVELSVGHV